MINLRHVEAFYAVMRTGTVTEAARTLNVTQPAVSVAIKQFESRLGMRLFDRQGGRLQPTPEARALLPDVADIFGRLGAIERYSQDLAQGGRGHLAIAATPPLCDGLVARAVAGFLEARPGVKVSLHAIASSAVLDRVVNREIDLGVVYENVESTAVRVVEVTRVPIGCVMPARHALARRATVRARDLERYPVVTYLPQALLRPYINRALDHRTAQLRIVAEVATSATAIALAMHGAGLALVEPMLIAMRPVPGFVFRPLEPCVELRALLLLPRQPGSSRLRDDFIAHLHRTAA